jgi:RNA polymerase sigma-70 factor (ECF subfamily)
MSEANPFRELLDRVRAGDQQAAAELVRHYEPLIRRTVRLRLKHPQLGRILDSMDICQSVFASFFARTALGQYQLHTQEDLLKLLVVMVRNKVATQARKRLQARQDCSLEAAGVDEEAAASGPSPSVQIADQDLLQEFRKRLSPQDRQIAEWRSQGRPWEDIAADLGGSAEALRKHFDRAVDRVARQLGLEESSDE